MTTLTTEQKDFLLENKIPLGTVFDAEGLPKKEYSQLMKDVGCLVAIGVTPCKKAGHTMRTRAGHCLQCDSSKWAYQSRHSKEGEVYLAVTLSGEFLKIGTANDATKRIKTLNDLGYAGVSDWALVAVFASDAAGEVEFNSQKLIEDFAYPTSYKRDEKNVSCLETFRCSSNKALDAIKVSIPNIDAQKFFNKELFELANQFKEVTGSFIRSGNVTNDRAVPVVKSTHSLAEVKVAQKNDNASIKNKLKESNSVRKEYTLHKESTSTGFKKTLMIVIGMLILIGVFKALIHMI